MTDIVERLRVEMRAASQAKSLDWDEQDEKRVAWLRLFHLFRDAIDEIERLRAANTELQGVDATLQLALERAQRERDEARAALEWQPIETAPKDGTPMMLFYQTLGVRYGHWDHIGTADWWVADINGDDPSGWACPYQEDDLDPTHWRPLPPPPEGKP